MKKIQLLTFCLFFEFLTLKQLMAAELPGANTVYNYRGPEVLLRKSIEKFAENIGYPVIISEKINARIDAKIPMLTRKGFLDKLAVRYRLVWYFDGGVLHVSSLSELETTTITLNSWTAHEIVRELKNSGLWEPRFIRTGHPLSRLIVVVAPVSYSKVLNKLVHEIDKSSPRGTEIVAIIKEDTTPFVQDNNDISTVLDKIIKSTNNTTSSPLELGNQNE
ncbi:MAG: hypothetical protein V7776_23010 [Halopseudomonas aestusnigri]